MILMTNSNTTTALYSDYAVHNNIMYSATIHLQDYITASLTKVICVDGVFLIDNSIDVGWKNGTK